MDSYILRLITDPANRQKPGGLLGKLSAACYNHYLIHSCDSLNPFNNKTLKYMKKSYLAQAAPFIPRSEHAPAITSEDIRRIASYTHNNIVRGSADVNIRARALRNLAVLQLGIYTGARGASLLDTELEHLRVGADAASPLRATLWWILHRQKNDVNGANGPVAYPLLPDLNNGYECVLLALAQYLSVMAPAFAEAIKLKASNPELKDAKIYLFPGNTRSGKLNPFQRWTPEDGRTQLKNLACAALDAQRRLVFHCCRQTLSLRFAAEGGSTHEMGTWGGWRGDDINNYLKQGDPGTMYAIAARRRGWELAPQETNILPYLGELSAQHGSGLVGTGMALLSGYLRRVLECFVNDDLPDHLFYSADAGGLRHTVTYSPPAAPASALGKRKRRSGAICTPQAIVEFNYHPTAALTSVCAAMIKKYDIKAVRVARELPAPSDAASHSPAAAFRVQQPSRRIARGGQVEDDGSQAESEEEAGPPPPRQDTAAQKSMAYARTTILETAGTAIAAALTKADLSPNTLVRTLRAVRDTVDEGMRAGGGGGGGGGARPPATATTTTGLHTSAHSGRPLVPALAHLIDKDWGNVGKVWDLWDGKLEGYPPLKEFRGSPTGSLVWQWDPSSPTEHQRCQRNFALIQAVVTELLCYLKDYERFHAPTSDPAPTGIPAAYVPVTQEDWEQREDSMPAGRAWALAQMAHRWQGVNTERVYNLISTKNKKSVDGLSPWEQQRDKLRREFKAFNRTVSMAKPTPAGGVKRKGGAKSNKEAKTKSARIMPTAADVKGGLKLYTDARAEAAEATHSDEDEDAEEEEAEEEGTEVEGAEEGSEEEGRAPPQHFQRSAQNEDADNVMDIPGFVRKKKGGRSRPKASAKPKLKVQARPRVKRLLHPDIMARFQVPTGPLPKGMFEDAAAAVDDARLAAKKKTRR
jgi:hypothetical protein